MIAVLIIFWVILFLVMLPWASGAAMSFLLLLLLLLIFGFGGRRA